LLIVFWLPMMIYATGLYIIGLWRFIKR